MFTFRLWTIHSRQY